MVETGPAVSTSVTARTPLGGLVEAFAGSFAAITAPVAGAGGGTGGGDYHPLSALPAAFALAAATAWLFTGQARSWQLPASYIGRLQVPPG